MTNKKKIKKYFFDDTSLCQGLMKYINVNKLYLFFIYNITEVLYSLQP